MLGGCFATTETYDKLIQALAEAIAMCITEHPDAEPPGTKDENRMRTAPVATVAHQGYGLRIEVYYDSRPRDADDQTRPGNPAAIASR